MKAIVDGKPVKTPARRALVAPSAALAEKIAEEWNAQAEVIDPARMPLTRLARTKYARLFNSRTRANRLEDMPLKSSSATSPT